MPAPSKGYGHTTGRWTADRYKQLGTSGVAGRPSPPARRNPGDEAAAAQKKNRLHPTAGPDNKVRDTQRALGRPTATTS